MGTPRNVSNPVMKTYIVPSGTAIHVRVYAPKFSLDKRGTGRTLSDAVKNALHGIPKTKRKKISRGR
jgi:hypothetical protein